MITLENFKAYEHPPTIILVPPHCGTFTLQKWTVKTMNQAEELFGLVGVLATDDPSLAYAVLPQPATSPFPPVSA